MYTCIRILALIPNWRRTNWNLSDVLAVGLALGQFVDMGFRIVEETFMGLC